MLPSLLAKPLSLFLGVAYPAYASYKAVRTKDVREYVKWMMYWIVFAAFTCAEAAADIFLAFWFPFYYELKIVLLLWLVTPVSRGSLGSSILYRKVVHPNLLKREEEIDRVVARAQEQSYAAVARFGRRALEYATDLVMKTAIKAPAVMADLANQAARMDSIDGGGGDVVYRRQIQADQGRFVQVEHQNLQTNAAARFYAGSVPMEEEDGDDAEVYESFEQTQEDELGRSIAEMVDAMAGGGEDVADGDRGELAAFSSDDDREAPLTHPQPAVASTSGAVTKKKKTASNSSRKVTAKKNPILFSSDSEMDVDELSVAATAAAGDSKTAAAKNPSKKAAAAAGPKRKGRAAKSRAKEAMAEAAAATDGLDSAEELALVTASAGASRRTGGSAAARRKKAA